MPLSTNMPADFVSHIHQALKAWHDPADTPEFAALWLAQPPPSPGERSTSRTTANRILQAGLDALRQTHPEAAKLLQRRFQHGETAREIAYHSDFTVDIVYQRQRVAIAQLAEVIWAQESALRREKARRVELRLEAPTYTRLFGIDTMLAEARAQLESPDGPWLLALEGMGGIGKPTLADALGRQLAPTPRFTEIAWVSARTRLFHLTGEIGVTPDAPVLTPHDLVDRLVEQLGLHSLKRQSDREKFLGMKDYFKAQPCLVALDNLETLADYRALLPQLREWVRPSKLLLTTRHSLRGESGVYILPITGLTPEDTLAFIRYEATAQGLGELAQAPDDALQAIHTLTGGNPLALKLVLGQVHTFPLPAILARFKAAEGGGAAALFDFIYQDAWERLDAPGRTVLQALLLVPEGGGDLAQIAAVASLSPGEAADCLQRLALYSLVEITGDLHTRRYGLHPLTQSFVERQAWAEESSGGISPQEG